MELKVSCFTPSYNKGQIAVEGVKSILNQTYQNFEFVVVDNSDDDHTRKLMRRVCKNQDKVLYIEQDFSEDLRKSQFVGSLLVNEYLPNLTGDLIIYKSDDDLLYPDCFERCVTYFVQHPDTMAVWFSMNVTEQDKDGFFHLAEIKADRPIGFGTKDAKLDCMLDGGQIMYRKECLRDIKQPFYSPDWLLASHADGGFMDKLAEKYTFYPIDSDYLLEHRRTEKSTFTGLNVR